MWDLTMNTCCRSNLKHFFRRGQKEIKVIELQVGLPSRPPLSYTHEWFLFQNPNELLATVYLCGRSPYVVRWINDSIKVWPLIVGWEFLELATIWVSYDKLVVIGIIRPMIYLHYVCTCELVFGHDPVFLWAYKGSVNREVPLLFFPFPWGRLRKEMGPLEFLLAWASQESPAWFITMVPWLVHLQGWSLTSTIHEKQQITAGIGIRQT
jgi:hypothetical protein